MADFVFPESELTPRGGDEELSGDQLCQLGLFADFKKPPNFDRYPGSLILRRYDQGDVICRQGDPGATAFYILTSRDVVQLKQGQLAAARQESAAANGVKDRTIVRRLKQQVERLNAVVAQFETRVSLQQEAGEDHDDLRRVAAAHLLIDSAPRPQSKTVWQRLGGTIFGGSKRVSEKRPEFIPNDGPTDINYETKQAPMFEGDVFGEMSCMTLAPRSATVIAETECYMLEFLRNIFEQMQRDPGYREKIDAAYRERVLKGHLRRLEILAGVGDQELEFVRDRAELTIVDPGDVICDEHDPSDAVYIIRSGMVQVVSGLYSTLGLNDVKDWQALCKELLQGAGESGDQPEADDGGA